jgi:leucyl-tRNA synthetase
MNQGQVLALTPYRKPREGEKLEVGEEGILVSYEEAKALPQDQLMWRWARMSKSKGNVVTPDEMVEQFGADALRIHELFVAPFEGEVQWDSSRVEKDGGKFLNRVFRMVNELAPMFDTHWRSKLSDHKSEAEGVIALRRATHQAIKKASEDIERFAFNTYVAALMTFLNEINDAIRNAERNNPDWIGALSEAIETFILLLSPAAPFSADELWESLGKSGFTYRQPWPAYSAELAAEDTLNIAIQINGKLRDTMQISATASNDDLQKAALSASKVVSFIDGRPVKKMIVVPGKLVNIVVES